MLPQADSSTKLARPVSPFLEEILGLSFEVLDHGFVRVIDYMGNDQAIVQSARVSYGMGTKSVREDRGLIRYLMRNDHTSPFEHCELKLHCKMPIFVARQWVRHRTASINEYSARYSILKEEFYVPDQEHLAVQATSNRQGRGGQVPPKHAQEVQDVLTNDALAAYQHYAWMLNERNVARELARMDLTLNYYTEWYWKINLHNLLHFLQLRLDLHAQYEIRVYAQLIYDLVSKWVPFTIEAFRDYRLEALTLSGPQVRALQALLMSNSVSLTDYEALSPTEWKEFQNALGISQLSIQKASTVNSMTS